MNRFGIAIAVLGTVATIVAAYYARESYHLDAGTRETRDQDANAVKADAEQGSDSRNMDGNQSSQMSTAQALPGSFIQMTASDYLMLYNKSRTDLAQKQWEEELIGKTVRWHGRVVNVTEISSLTNRILVLVDLGDKNLNLAALQFGEEYRDLLAGIQKGAEITFQCDLLKPDAGPHLNNCQVIDIKNDT